MLQINKTCDPPLSTNLLLINRENKLRLNDLVPYHLLINRGNLLSVNDLRHLLTDKMIILICLVHSWKTRFSAM